MRDAWLGKCNKVHGIESRLVAKTATVLVLAACVSHLDSPVHDLLIWANADPVELRQGETMTIRVVVTNRGGGPRAITSNRCPEPFVVTTQDGTVVAPPQRICTLIAETKTLAPGEEFVFSVGWPGDRRLETLNPLGRGSSTLPPGTYHLRGRVGTELGLLESEPVTIRIVP
jgi:hypothetical protein